MSVHLFKCTYTLFKTVDMCTCICSFFPISVLTADWPFTWQKVCYIFIEEWERNNQEFVCYPDTWRKWEKKYIKTFYVDCYYYEAMLCHGLLKCLQTIQQTNILLLYMDSQEQIFPKENSKSCRHFLYLELQLVYSLHSRSWLFLQCSKPPGHNFCL